MTNKLKGKRVAILVTDGFEQVEMTNPRKALDEAGAVTTLISPKAGEVQGWNHHEKGDRFRIDRELKSTDPNNFDALMLPGGVANPDQLRTIPGGREVREELFCGAQANCRDLPWALVAGGSRSGSWI